MNPVLHLGRATWSPSPLTESISVYHQWDYPRIGVIRQGDQMFLYDCVEEVAQDCGIWEYRAITPWHHIILTSVEDAEHFRLLLTDVETSIPVGALALDRGDDGIIKTWFLR